VGPQNGMLLLVATLAGAAAGAATGWLPRFPSELQPLRNELRRDDVVMRIEVPDERQGQLEQEIKARHPEIRVKGTDPAGSPPFP
jgi:HAMP domain-containing protein